MTHPLFNLQMRPIGRESPNKQVVFLKRLPTSDNRTWSSLCQNSTSSRIGPIDVIVSAVTGRVGGRDKAGRHCAGKSRAGGLCVFNCLAFCLLLSVCVCVCVNLWQWGLYNAHRLKSNVDSCHLFLCVSTAVVQVDGSPVRLQLCDTAGQVSSVHTQTHVARYSVPQSHCTKPVHLRATQVHIFVFCFLVHLRDFWMNCLEFRYKAPCWRMDCNKCGVPLTFYGAPSSGFTLHFNSWTIFWASTHVHSFPFLTCEKLLLFFFQSF